MVARKVQTTNDMDDAQAVVRSLDQLADSSKAIADSIESLEALGLTTNPEQSALTDIANTVPTISASYVQSEIDSLAADIKIVSDKVDTILSALRSANILGE